MKMYDPVKKDSFVMQFGFKSPNWHPRTKNTYIKKEDRKSE